MNEPEVQCDYCGWTGDVDDLHHYNDVSVCPSFGCDAFVDYEEEADQ